ncbi:tryptophan--tRNA ligase [Spiroplasma turonicum]|uniref:Tryptophan--tRNA ligase n=1 Tax=Spiroplasma turonicum TaxID=216946 RepID=A0A0K1P789_9MOLU|nr:tryptophan--tRNA ligase [Spiroplasma turonicum]AKU80143.1 tryptophanyl-tRNA synthetase [Spiroplasma turonicum]ALX71143.1 tryptophanyl-tRNA synthetase [Spiroplasma turonicum]
MEIKKRMVSGITATGTITLGNYIGAIKNFVSLQDEFEMFIFVANLHAITTHIDKTVLKNNIKNMIALYFACGLDPNKSNVFIQSEVLEHTQLCWILTCNSTIGELNRMTQFKDKSNKVKSTNGTDFIPTGLLTYPLLMASDILLYDPDYVPVGKDQKQHIELARNIAERMNNKYGEMFKIPEDYISKVGNKIMDLQDPTKKMSKSSENPKSYISLLDDLNTIDKKIKSALTDSENIVKYDPINKPGISNLITIYSSITNIEPKDVENNFKNKDYGVFKNEVSKVVCDLISGIQKKYNEVINSNEIDNWLEEAANKARFIARKKLNKVMNLIGLNYKRK